MYIHTTLHMLERDIPCYILQTARTIKERVANKLCVNIVLSLKNDSIYFFSAINDIKLLRTLHIAICVLL